MKIDYDAQMNRHYIPLPGGWEVQTKGNGSTFRISDNTRNERMPIPLPDRILDFLERMARDIHAAATSKEPVAVRYDYDGFGWKYIDNGSGSDWLTRHPDGEVLTLAASNPASILAACYTEAMNLSQTEFVHIKPEYRALQEAAKKACVSEPGLAFPVYLLMRGYWNDASMWAEKPETNWMDDDEAPGNLEVHEALDAEGMATDRDASQDGASAPRVGEVPPESEEQG